jgi:hypothetical protein
MEYTKELYDLLKQESELLKKLAQANVIKQTEFLAFDITLQQQELTYLQAQIQYNADYLTLNYLAGIADTTIMKIEEPKLEDTVVHDFYSSVFYKRYITDSLRIRNERKLIDYGYRPTFNAFTDAGFNSSLQNTPYKNVGFSFGVNIKMPLYDGRQRNFDSIYAYGAYVGLAAGLVVLLAAAVARRDALARLGDNLMFIMGAVLLVFCSHKLFPFQAQQQLAVRVERPGVGASEVVGGRDPPDGRAVLFARPCPLPHRPGD